MTQFSEVVKVLSHQKSVSAKYHNKLYLSSHLLTKILPGPDDQAPHPSAKKKKILQSQSS